MVRRRFVAIEKPFIHAPEMGGFEVRAEIIDEARDEGELFGRADRAANAGGVIGSGLFPGGDVFERFGEIEILEGVVHDDLEAGAGELQHFLGREARRHRG